MVAWEEVSKVCRDYIERRSGYARTNFPYYALHDVPHLENVRHIGRELYLTLCPRDLRYTFYEAFWDCSAYTHDLGMAVGPRELDALGLHTSALRDYLKAEETSAGRGLAGKLSKFPNFFTSYGDNKNLLEWGRVEIPKDVKESDPAFAEFVRRIHPWISYELVKKELAEELRDLFRERGRAMEYAKHVGLVAFLHWEAARLDLPPAVFEGYGVDFRFWGAVIKLADALDATEERATRKLGYIRDVLKNDIGQATHMAFKILRKVRGVSHSESGVKITYDRIVLDVGPGREEAELLGFLIFEVGENMYKDYKTAADALHASHGIRSPPLWIKAGDREESLEPYLLHLREAHEKIENIKLTKDSPYVEELERSGAPKELVDLLATAVEEGKKTAESQQDECQGKCEKNEKKKRGYNPLDALAVAVLTQTPADGIVRLILRDLDSREVEKLLKALAH
jgi:hypothetical protein